MNLNPFPWPRFLRETIASAAFLALGLTQVSRAQSNVVIDGTSGNNSVGTSYSVGSGLNLSLGFFADYLVVGGGGGGGGALGGSGGGGGGGQVFSATNLRLNPSTGYTVIVGSGGAAGNTNTGVGGTGGLSSISGFFNGTSATNRANGGGGGGGLDSSFNGVAPSTGASGGGGGAQNLGRTTGGVVGTTGQGNRGGNGIGNDTDPNLQSGGGGGGAGGVGSNGSTGRGGPGGIGLTLNFTGVPASYGGGGGGGKRTTSGLGGGAGGSGGGGNGGTATAGLSGAANTGGGGGGGGNAAGGQGGSGVVIVRYAGGVAGTGGNVAAGVGSANGYTIHTFTNSGSLSFAGLNLNTRLGATLTGTLTGSGGVTYSGPGTLILTADNSYSGDTTITGGMLQVGDGGTTGSLGAGQVINNAALAFRRADALTFSSTISGAGSVMQNGSGTTTLSAVNSYTGGTTINAGALVLGGANRLADTGAVTVNDGAFDLGGFSETVGAVRLAGGEIKNGTLTGSSFEVENGIVSAVLAGTAALTKNSGGIVELNRANTFSGAVTLNNGMLILDHTQAVAQADGISFGAGERPTLAIRSAFQDAIFTVNKGLNGGTNGLVSNLTSDAKLAVNVASNTTASFSGIIRGSGLALIKDGEGTQILAGSNSYGLETKINAGTLQVGNGGASGGLGAGDVINNATLVINRSSAYALGNDISGSGQLVQAGPGTTTLSGSNTYTGGTTVSAGRLATSGNERLADTGVVTVGSGGTFALGGQERIGSLGGAGAVELGGTLTTGADSSEFSGRITGAGSLVKDGAGIFTLSGSNNYTGDTSIHGGKLVLASSNSLGQASVVKIGAGGTLEASQRVVVGFVDLDGGTIIGSDKLVSALTLVNSGTVSGLADGSDFNAGILKRTVGLATVNGANSFTGTVKIEAGTIQMASGGSFDQGSSLYLYDGATMDLNGYAQAFSKLDGAAGTVSLGSGNLTVRGADNSDFGGVIQGSGRLFKDGTGVLTLTGANTHSGGTEVTGGRLVGNTTSLNGAITNTATVEFQQNDNANLGASITGDGAVVKSGAGALTIINAQAYTGTTSVEAGALKVNGSLAGGVTVQSGAMLGGSGSVGGQITVSEGGNLSPGNSPGVLTAANGLSLATGSTFTWELTGNTAAGRGTSFDGVDVTGGALSIGIGVTSSLVFDFVGSTVDWENVFWSEDRSWLVFDNANLPLLASGEIFDTVTFSADSTGKDLNSVVGREGASFTWTQNGNQVLLNYNSVPEPSAASLMILSAGALLALKRRRGAV